MRKLTNNKEPEEPPLTGQIDLVPNKHRGKVIGDKIKEARAGDVLAGKATLQAATAALYLITKKKPIDAGDFEALRFLHKALQDYLYDGIDLHRALCIENEGGRPRERDTSIFLAIAMDREIDEQLKRGDELSIERALDRVAREGKVSASQAEKAWLDHGGKKGHDYRAKSRFQSLDWEYRKGPPE
ncbi:MAG: hypothetical protein H0X43_10310 [Nitrosospira sp.]|nr:hypothetical protein [Nitrosospira sp.]